MSTVLVTGGSGFVGSHCVRQLLEAGHRVRTTVRSLGREAEVRTMMQGAAPEDRLSVFLADLENDASWDAAVAGCDYVLHVASPLPPGAPMREEELIGPARDGTLRVLKAARAAGVKRVVLTSSTAAVSYGHAARATPYDETDWSDPHAPDLQPYMKSKTLAERAAWNFVAEGGLELSVINPVGIFGPALGPDVASSLSIVKRLMDGTTPFCPKFYFAVVDVRDVADLHIRAMTDPAAKGERFIASSGDPMSMLDIAKVLKARLGDAARHVPTREVPNWLVRLAALRDPALRLIVPQLGKIRRVCSAKARRVLGWTPRSSAEAIVATAESLVRLNLLKAA